MAKLEYKANRQGIRELLKSSETVGLLKTRAEAVAQRAEGLAPSGRGRHAEGDAPLRDSIVVVQDSTRDRSRVRVVADKPYARYHDNAWLVQSVDAAGF